MIASVNDMLICYQHSLVDKNQTTLTSVVRGAFSGVVSDRDKGWLGSHTDLISHSQFPFHLAREAKAPHLTTGNLINPIYQVESICAHPNFNGIAQLNKDIHRSSLEMSWRHPLLASIIGEWNVAHSITPPDRYWC